MSQPVALNSHRGLAPDELTRKYRQARDAESPEDLVGSYDDSDHELVAASPRSARDRSVRGGVERVQRGSARCGIGFHRVQRGTAACGAALNAVGADRGRWERQSWRASRVRLTAAP
jgi:hypothetical protein